MNISGAERLLALRQVEFPYGQTRTHSRARSRSAMASGNTQISVCGGGSTAHEWEADIIDVNFRTAPMTCLMSAHSAKLTAASPRARGVSLLLLDMLGLACSQLAYAVALGLAEAILAMLDKHSTARSVC